MLSYDHHDEFFVEKENVISLIVHVQLNFPSIIEQLFPFSNCNWPLIFLIITIIQQAPSQQLLKVNGNEMQSDKQVLEMDDSQPKTWP